MDQNNRTIREGNASSFHLVQYVLGTRSCLDLVRNVPLDNIGVRGTLYPNDAPQLGQNLVPGGIGPLPQEEQKRGCICPSSVGGV